MRLITLEADRIITYYCSAILCTLEYLEKR